MVWLGAHTEIGVAAIEVWQFASSFKYLLVGCDPVGAIFVVNEK